MYSPNHNLLTEARRDSFMLFLWRIYRKLVVFNPPSLTHVSLATLATRLNYPETRRTGPAIARPSVEPPGRANVKLQVPRIGE